MEYNKYYEKTRIGTRLKSFFTLFVFILATLFISLLVMDFIVFPVTIFSIESKELFTRMVKYALGVLLTSYFTMRVSARIKYLKKSGLRGKALTKAAISHRMASLVMFLFFIIFASIILLTVYYVLVYNSRLLHYINF